MAAWTKTVDYMKIEKIIAYRNNKVSKFEKAWKLFIEI